MIKNTVLKLALLTAGVLALPIAQAAAMSNTSDKAACGSQTGNAKDICIEEGKAKEKVALAVEVKALADAKLGKEIGEARKDAASDKRDADYKVAIQKCDALAGDAKSSCVTSAKMTFGKT